MAEQIEEVPAELIQTRVYELHPNKTMRKVLDEACDYRRYCWNQGLALWNEMYKARKAIKSSLASDPKKLTEEQKVLLKEKPSPSERRVRNMLVADKKDWQYTQSARILQLAISDLGKAWNNFFDKAQPGWGKPKFRSKREARQGFKSDRSKIKDGILYLERARRSSVPKDQWCGFKLSEKPLSDEFGVVSYFKEKGRYYVAIPYKIKAEDVKLPDKTGKATAVDVNVGHFDYTGGRVNVLPKRLDRIYKKIKHYQRQLAKKRVKNGEAACESINYLKTKAKLQACYRKAGNIQNDLMHKFTTELINDYDKIVIENLSVKGMLMSHVASKGVHRSMFGKFRQILTYKCDWYGKELILANKLYPSTQRCAACGNVKKGDDKITLYGNKKHGTKHNEYICYNKKCPNYNKVVDRDKNAMLSLLALTEHPELNHAL
ncbi:transposase [Lactobacillus delbrueckii subsp. lactis DSM 20072]|uniref:RNA-guided endonuclease InsQ/TnpB family protein n=2 Tax=Lactobacillus delbrueckii TaxID=1584 RepID=UPI000202FD11|nr:RNA-guided endonuclease TnpB family protein [Lactobacillus delbrueckii]ASW12115.1 transposase [Lactobacillus delbrueckii subsp. lactis DSM 20072]EGD28128.1 transposase [Lactobacillus delbrueckii subsp. lactis DSM 20072]OOV09558.1 transposase [Lactobacillus delbrueckii subsp. lactis DSM 20072]